MFLKEFFERDDVYKLTHDFKNQLNQLRKSFPECIIDEPKAVTETNTPHEVFA